MNADEVLNRLTEIIVRYSGSDATPFQIGGVRQKLADALLSTPERLTLVLPAFPFKSSNWTKKVIGPDPDYGEEVALIRLSDLCEELAEVIPVKFLIVSDGHVFNDIFCIPDENVDSYFDRLEALNTSPHIEFLRLRDLLPEDASMSILRDQLIRDYAEKMEDVLERIFSNEGDRAMYCGMKRFMSEEFSQKPGESYNQFARRTGEMAKQICQRSEAYSRLIAEKLPGVFRLSIHPRNDWSEKVSIRLVPSTDRWATPWHNVAVLDHASGSVALMHRADAEKACYKPEWRSGRLWRYTRHEGSYNTQCDSA